ncbi:MAG: glycoside hydrolase 100 family protein [Bacteroidia bacterium]
MDFDKISPKTDWFERSSHLLREACTPWGIKASLTKLDNYGAIFTRDAVMAGIAGVLIQDDIIIEGFKNTLLFLKKLQGKQGQIASNFTIKDNEVEHVSFGTLGPKIDACTWYMVGVGILINEGIISREDFKESVEKTIDLLNGLEYNNKHLMYIPKGGNWADEYVFDGYILYDQVLRSWGLGLLAKSYKNHQWLEKSAAILGCIETQYKDEDRQYFSASFFPGGVFNKFDLAAHSILAIVLEKEQPFMNHAFDWIGSKFIEQNMLPPAFYPVINKGDKDWDTLRGYHLFDFKNKPHHYHNGGIWLIWLGWLSIALSILGKDHTLSTLIQTTFNKLESFEQFNFEEYISADELTLNGTKKLCYTATGIIMLSLAKDSYDFSILKP